MGLEIRREPDGTVAFICSRGGATPEERQREWIAEEALRQQRCPLCMTPLGPRSCGVEKGACQRPAVSVAQAVGILRGMIVG